jgi:hypothetical protein
MIATAKGIFMPLYSTLATMKLLAGAIDAKEDKVETALPPDRRRHLSAQLEWLRARFSREYSQFLAATEKQEESFTSERIASS